MGRQQTGRVQAKGTATRRTKATTTKKPGRKSLHPIRRILAQRIAKAGAVTTKKYLVDWYPSWEPASALQFEQEIVGTWEKHKSEDHTFKFGEEIVYRCSNPTEDNSDYYLRVLTDGVLEKFKDFMNRRPEVVAADLFNDDRDWVFATDKDKEYAENVAMKDGFSPAPSAMQVLRIMYKRMRSAHETKFKRNANDNLDEHMKANKNSNTKKRDYSKIKLKYLGQVDDALPRPTTAERQWYMRVSQILDPLFNDAVNFSNLEPEDWEKPEELHDNYKPLSDMAAKFATIAPYMLKHPWPMMFARLFHWSQDLAAMLEENLGIEVTEDWCNHTRDFFLYTYMKTFPEEQRTVDCVERTYLDARDKVRWHVLHRSETEELGGQEENGTQVEGNGAGAVHESGADVVAENRAGAMEKENGRKAQFECMADVGDDDNDYMNRSE
jgi:hypothetical protein